MNPCKRCKKREINTSRSNMLCTECLESGKLRSRKSATKTGLPKIRKALGFLAVSMNLCKACFHAPIYVEHSSFYCKSCFENRHSSNIKHKESHRDAAIKKSAEWRKLNPERVKSGVKSWTLRNKDKVRVMSKNRKARVRNAEGNFTESEWLSLLDRYDYRCLWCGTTSDKLTADHVIPITKGGSNYIENIQPLCASCNSKKHTKTIDFRPFGSAILEWT